MVPGTVNVMTHGALSAPPTAEHGSTRDDAQRAIITLPVAASGVVIGAPGTGKTSTLVERVEWLLGAGLPPDEVLVLTPSRQSATALRDRLAIASGAATSGSMARSVASFAFQIVRAAEVHAGGQPPVLLTGGDEDQMLQDLLTGDEADARDGHDRWPSWLGAQVRSTQAFRSEVRAFMAECAALGIDAEALTRIAASTTNEVWHSLSTFMGEYQQVRSAMRGAHRDPAALVREAAVLLRGARGDAPSLGALARLRAVLVDDAQELTIGGVELLEACAARGMAVLAFGDPDVGSGAFRGAAPEYFARLAGSLGSVHVLPDIHRGTAAQRDLVRTVTQRIGAAGLVAHRSAPRGTVDDESVTVMVCRSASEEYDAIARLLRERHVHGGVPWNECAVIAHDSRQVAALEAELIAREVPGRSSGASRALGLLAPVRDLLHVVTLAHRDDADWSPSDVDGALLGAFGGLDAVSLRRLRTTLRHAEVSEAGVRGARELLRSALATPLELALIDTREARRAARVGEAIARVRLRAAEGATIHELLWAVWEKSGLERAWGEAARGTGPLAEQANRDLDGLVALFQAAKRFVEREQEGTSEPMVFVRHVLDSDVADDDLTALSARAVVQIITPASALGTQFDTVIIAGVQERVWPNVRTRGGLLDTWRLADVAAGITETTTDALDRRRSVMYDELRLFVRAISRATRRLVVTAVDDDDTGPSVFFEFLPEPERSTRGKEHPLSLRGLVAEHRRALTDPAVAPRARQAAPAQLALLADARVAGAHPREWYGVTPLTSLQPLRDVHSEDVRVSPSRLHAIEECELNWVIADLGGDTSGGAVAGLGVILHSALETAEGTDEASLMSVVESRWGELEFDAPWRERQAMKRAHDLVHRLHRYLGDFESSGGTLLGAEPHFEIPLAFHDEAGPGEHTAGTASDAAHRIVVSGYIDRVELTAAGEVVIVDLKTGKSEPQSDAKVIDNPQLAAYQLAFESGQIEGTQGRLPGGAKLLVLVPTSSKTAYAAPWQPPFDDEARSAFITRVRSAAGRMAGTSFVAPFEEHCRKDHSYGLCRIHTVRPVSAS